MLILKAAYRVLSVFLEGDRRIFHLLPETNMKYVAMFIAFSIESLAN